MSNPSHRPKARSEDSVLICAATLYYSCKSKIPEGAGGFNPLKDAELSRPLGPGSRNFLQFQPNKTVAFGPCGCVGHSGHCGICNLHIINTSHCRRHTLVLRGGSLLLRLKRSSADLPVDCNRDLLVPVGTLDLRRSASPVGDGFAALLNPFFSRFSANFSVPSRFLLYFLSVNRVTTNYLLTPLKSTT